MLKHLFRGWWARGYAGKGLREAGCGEEGGQPGYNASGLLTQ